MPRLIRWGYLAVCLGCAGLAFGRPMPVPEEHLLGTSDLVVVAVVVDDQRLSGEGELLGGRATLAVEQTLKGTAPARVTARHDVPLPPSDPPIMDFPGFMLEQGQRGLFFLQRYRTEYLIIGGLQGIRQPEEAGEFARKIAAFPLVVSFAGQVGPFCFGRLTPVQVSVSNRGNTAIDLRQIELEGLFYAPRLNERLVCANVSPEGTPFLPTLAKLEAGETWQRVFTFECRQPSSWLIYAPETYLQSPIMVRARVMVMAPQVAGQPINWYPVASPWAESMAGYPPPER